MKINKEQFDALVAKLDALQTQLNRITMSHEDCHWCQALRSGFDTLAAEVRSHDEWAKAYNVTVEERNAAAVARIHKQGEEYDAWRKSQLDAVISVVEMFERMEKAINFIQHELLVNGKPKPRRRAKK